ncbi:uncharacterized protein LOC133626833 isoform X3 [Colius striatus]|uniref:uncharacterized protein LOC133626833 isoform X3 n=1 Tax=Colius striatus TaxID=57412 RepID=UPI002B1E6FBD|nr:uncharacterized protein LOC133626833 isoform X3 [Colius striatus]
MPCSTMGGTGLCSSGDGPCTGLCSGGTGLCSSGDGRHWAVFQRRWAVHRAVFQRRRAALGCVPAAMGGTGLCSSGDGRHWAVFQRRWAVHRAVFRRHRAVFQRRRAALGCVPAAMGRAPGCVPAATGGTGLCSSGDGRHWAVFQRRRAALGCVPAAMGRAPGCVPAAPGCVPAATGGTGLCSSGDGRHRAVFQRRWAALGCVLAAMGRAPGCVSAAMGGTGLCFSGNGRHRAVFQWRWAMHRAVFQRRWAVSPCWCLLRDLAVSVEDAGKGRHRGATIDMKRTFKTYWCKWNWFYNMLKRGCAEDGPDTILQMDVSLGKRWCFPGHYGRVVIRLPAPVHPTAIAVQHVTKEGSLSVAASSAPRDVAVYPLRVLDKSSRQRLSSSSASTRLWLLPRRGQGLGADGDEEAWHTYDVEKEDIQAFHLKNTLHPRAFSYIKVLILNNWGNSEYICTSRVWVHGKMAKPESPL